MRFRERDSNPVIRKTLLNITVWDLEIRGKRLSCIFYIHENVLVLKSIFSPWKLTTAYGSLFPLNLSTSGKFVAPVTFIFSILMLDCPPKKYLMKIKPTDIWQISFQKELPREITSKQYLVRPHLGRSQNKYYTRANIFNIQHSSDHLVANIILIWRDVTFLVSSEIRFFNFERRKWWITVSIHMTKCKILD